MVQPATQQNTIHGLECMVTGCRIVLPLTEIDQLIEYRRNRLPLTRLGVTGVGVYNDSILLSLSVSDVAAKSDRVVKGILLRYRVDDLHLAIEVEESQSFVNFDLATVNKASPLPWMQPGKTTSGLAGFHIDIQMFLQAHGLTVDA